MNRQRYDLAVIGAGAGGSAAAIYAARAGARTVLIEADEQNLGGSSINSGDLPSKVFALYCQKPGSNWRAAAKQARLSSASARQNLLRLCRDQPSLDLLFGRASLDNRGGVMVEGGRRIEASRIIVASGSRPAVPSVVGLKQSGYDTVDNFLLRIRRKPRQVAILGGGASAAELASALSSLGIKVYLIEHNSRLLKDIDEEASDFLTGRLEAAGVQVITSGSLVKANKPGDKFQLLVQRYGKPYHLRADALVVAAGRRPRLPRGLKRSGAIIKPDGIEVDGNWQTANARIYAIGDTVSGGARLSHSAAWAGSQAARHALFGLKAAAPIWQPQCIYTDPPIAVAGVTIQQLIKQGQEYKTTTVAYGAADPVSCVSPDGYIKVVTDYKQRLLGAVCVGPAAGEIIGYLAVAIERGIPIEQLARLPLPYPSASASLHRLAAEAEPSRREHFGKLARLRLSLQ
ncbi:MAG: NAD(P)/FAD-dependent oxidoreductase [Candidatus Chaera renei]|uniref:NAD(P)/FAD-dependent oxidoreductase n=1 Tax=Candidatus Chaera renei TaxID=2506947 RepID=A0A4Q0AK16_9BACT|nr:MAG: NAD(P)/FAD-dependent oxidoreductase [Candidatus Chaera renei]